MGNSSVTSSFNSTFAVILRDLLECAPKTGKRTTYKTLAKFLGVKQQSVSSWANGITTPEAKHIVQIAVYFGVSCDFMLGRSRASSPDDFLQAVVSRYGLSEQALQFLEDLNTQDEVPPLGDPLIEVGNTIRKNALCLLNDILTIKNQKGEPYCLSVLLSIWNFFYNEYITINLLPADVYATLKFYIPDIFIIDSLLTKSEIDKDKLRNLELNKLRDLLTEMRDTLKRSVDCAEKKTKQRKPKK